MDPLIGQIVLGRFEVLQRIGSGGMGAVYVGRQHGLDRKIALKVLRTDLMNNEHVRMRFKREADIIARLKHPNTIQLIDYGETEEGLAIMVMELLNGLSLSEKLKADGPLGILPALKLGEEVCASLSEAHLYGLVHRDLKPANIFLNEVGREVHAKVLDFGIARLMDEEATRLTSTGQVFGTPRYMSPEQAMSTADVDARSDLYSLGLIIYECVVGQPPFIAQTSIQYLSAHSTQEPPKLRETAKDAPVELEALIDACLAKNPEERPNSAEDVGRVLKQIRTMIEIQTSPGIPIQIARGHPQGIVVDSRDTIPSNLTKPTDRAAPAADGEPQPPLATPSAPSTPSTAGAKAKAEAKPKKKSSSSSVAIGVFVAGLGALIGAGWYFFKENPAPLDLSAEAGTVVALKVEEDSGTAAEVAEAAPDATVAVVVAVAESEDAGTTATQVADDDVDAGTNLATNDPDPDGPDGPDRPRDPPPSKRKHPKHRHKQNNDNPAGDGVITGPRGLVIDGVGEEASNLAALAKSCTQSTWRGLAKLTTQGCPTGCAIIVDDQCAGQTPAEDRAMSGGRRNITVVCNGKARRTATIRFEDDESTVFRCK